VPAEDDVERELERAGWPLPSDAQRESARKAVDRRLQDTAGAASALAHFYDPAGPNAGRTFLDLQPVDPDRVTVADLLAVTTLDVRVRPRAVRRLLDPGDDRDEVGRKFSQVPQDADLAAVSAGDLMNAAELYWSVNQILGVDPWVVASKLCARKRPALIPVRDRTVVRLLGLADKPDYRKHWLVYRLLLRDHAVVAGVERAAADVAHTRGAPDLSNVPPLRLLDSLLWMTRSMR
jgi:hypothetical protein